MATKYRWSISRAASPNSYRLLMRRKGESNKSFLTKLQSFEKRCDFRDVGVGFLSGAGQIKNFGGRARRLKSKSSQDTLGQWGQNKGKDGSLSDRRYS